MAKPIRKTPLLKGKDAIHFLREVRENENKKVSVESVARGKSMYERIVARTK